MLGLVARPTDRSRLHDGRTCVLPTRLRTSLRVLFAAHLLDPICVDKAPPERIAQAILCLSPEATNEREKPTSSHAAPAISGGGGHRPSFFITTDVRTCGKKERGASMQEEVAGGS